MHHNHQQRMRNHHHHHKKRLRLQLQLRMRDQMDMKKQQLPSYHLPMMAPMMGLKAMKVQAMMERARIVLAMI